MVVQLNHNLQDFVDLHNEKVIFKQTVEVKDGFKTFPRNILITNKKFIYSQIYKTTAIPLKKITYVSLDDGHDRNNLLLIINDYVFYISKNQESVAKRIYSLILEQNHDLQGFVGLHDEKEIFRQIVDVKAGSKTAPVNISITNKKFMYSHVYKSTAIPLSTITYVSLDDGDNRDNFSLIINDKTFYISKNQLPIATKIFSIILKNL